MCEDILLGIGQVAQLLNYCDNYIRSNDKKLGLTPRYTGGKHRRYLLADMLKVKQRLEEERQK